MLEAIQIVQGWFHSVPSAVWGLLSTALGLSGLLEVVKTWVEARFRELKPREGKLAAVLLAVVGGLFTTVLDPSVFSLIDLGKYTGLVFASMTWLYWTFVKPLSDMNKNARSWKDSQTVAQPVSATPITDTTASVDF